MQSGRESELFLTPAFNLLCAVLCLVTQSCPTLCDPMDCSLPGSSVHEDSPGKNTKVGCHALLQEIFPTQGLEPRSPTLQVGSLFYSALIKLSDAHPNLLNSIYEFKC